ncbi:hypothetical protein R3P38DRAFT_3255847 [Favolaschia claudopus]|uniref:Uncharacterized protein n=1 Tax=Favolaschia claudopus TaxID=2862362 RepID=A0AAW0DNS5_9AGAR
MRLEIILASPPPFSEAGHAIEQPCCQPGCSYIHRVSGTSPLEDLQASVGLHAPVCRGRLVACNFPWQVDMEYLERAKFETSNVRTPMREPTPASGAFSNDIENNIDKKHIIDDDDGEMIIEADEDAGNNTAITHIDSRSNPKRRCTVKRKGVAAVPVQRKASTRKVNARACSVTVVASCSASAITKKIGKAPAKASSAITVTVTTSCSASATAIAGVPHVKTKGARTKKQRCDILSKDPWVRDFGAHHVSCKGCNKRLKLDRRSLFYPGLWNKHREKCKAIMAAEEGVQASGSGSSAL